MSDLFQRLADLGGRANQLCNNRLNHGGCCVYATLIAEQLEKMGLATELVVCNMPDGIWTSPMPTKTITETRLFLNSAGLCVGDSMNWQQHGQVYFNHVLVRFLHEGELYLLDSNEVTFDATQFRGMTVLPGGLTIIEGLALSHNRFNWSSRFDRKYIPSLAQLVNGELKQGLSEMAEWSEFYPQVIQAGQMEYALSV